MEEAKRLEEAARLEHLRRENFEKEERLKKEMKELEDRKRFYEENGPSQVQSQIRAVFRPIAKEEEKMDEPRFVELDD